MKTIVVGDIHGCYHEFMQLLEKCNYSPEDQLILAGDTISKGPKSKKVLKFIKKNPQILCVQGNHEFRIIQNLTQKEPIKKLYPEHQIVIEELGNKLSSYIEMIQKWPLYLEFKDFIVVHAGIRPGIPLNEQNPIDLVTLRTLEPHQQPWYEKYHGTKLIIHGHWAQQGLTIKENVIGLDSGCVYGKELSAVILPEKKIVQVPAKKIYKPI